MTAAEIVEIIKTVGFPIAVAAFVLIRLDKRLAEVVRALEALKDAVRAVENEPGATPSRLRPLLDEQRKEIVAEVNQDMRAAMSAFARRDWP